MSCSVVEKTLYLILSQDPILKVVGARDIRRLTKSSLRYRRLFSDAVKPLVDMLRSTSFETNEAALLALLNLSVKDEGNKKSIIDAGALEPIVGFLQSNNPTLQEHATASLLTLSASSVTKPTLASFGVIPLLVNILRLGTPQAKVDAIMTLYNLSTSQGNLTLILQTEPIPSIVSLLKSCKKSSKTAEKCTALIESLMSYEASREVLTSEEGGILAIVEVLEIGSLQSREHAVGALLIMCQSDRCKYREPILREGVIPGLLELTVKGTDKAKEKSQTLLRLLRDSPYQRSQFRPDTLENIVSNLISQIDGKEQGGKAQGLLAEVMQVSMDQSLRLLQQRPMVRAPVDLSVSGGISTISST
ncbi:U-box domain-containing protein 4-like [Lycium barbarum]|uniref:U-box domain-containing protein 4-like n=1 Tax=Lycium barbarum TaxID=112863 RepID=UPI00293F21B2|nr:U-box domain-containing protein 4-like [Lycium barbarum]